MAEYMYVVTFEATDSVDAMEVIQALDDVLEKMKRNNTRAYGTLGLGE
jgi:hypothetical protein